MREYTEDTVIYVLMSENKKFVGIVDFDSGKRFNFGFTSIDKAKEFVKINRDNGRLENVDKVYQCTINEYLQMQEKDPEFPYVAIDTDPIALSNYPLIVGDASKENIRVLKLEISDSKIYSIVTTPKE